MIDKALLERLSQFRFELRKFMRFGEEAARDCKVTAPQYHLMLHTQGFPDRDWASIIELAERLQIAAHGVVTLANRCEKQGLVRRQPNKDDGRLVEVHLTAKGRRIVTTLAAKHQAQLGELARVLKAALHAQA